MCGMKDYVSIQSLARIKSHHELESETIDYIKVYRILLREISMTCN